MEHWKIIPYLEGFAFSNTGKVKSLPRFVSNGVGQKKIPGCIRKTYILPNGYETVMIEGRTLYVHRIIAKAFIPNPDNLPQVNHKDGNKSNNNADNLEWCTASHNIRHAFRIGLSSFKNRKRGIKKIDKLQAKAIKSCLIDGLKPKEIAGYFKVTPGLIYNIKNGLIWQVI